MKTLSENAKGHLDKYLQEVRTCLSGCRNVDADEIERDIIEHIENELKSAEEPVGFDEVDAVIKRLGRAQQWVPEEEMSWWRKIVLRLRKGPEDWRLAYISFGLFLLSLLAGKQMPFYAVFFWPIIIFVFRGTYIFVFLLGSFCAARAVLSVTPNGGKLGGQKWLIYPSLVVFYLPIFFLLLMWPFFLLFAIAQGFDHAKIDMFPWNTGDETPYWTLVFIFLAGITFLWWLILAVVHKKELKLLEVVFHPFAKPIKPKILKRFMVIMAGLATVCLVAIALMMKYQGWSVYFIELLG